MKAIASCACSGVGYPARADRPDRLVGDHHVREPLARHARQIVLHLLAQLAVGVVVVALALRLPHAQDRRQAGRERRRHLQRQRPIGLAEQLSTLGVPEHDAVHVQLVEHRAQTPRP